MEKRQLCSSSSPSRRRCVLCIRLKWTSAIRRRTGFQFSAESNGRQLRLVDKTFYFDALKITLHQGRHYYFLQKCP